MMEQSDFISEIHKRADAEKIRIKKRKRNTAVIALTAAVIIPSGIITGKLLIDNNILRLKDDLITESFSEDLTQSAPPSPTGASENGLTGAVVINGRELFPINKDSYSVFSSELPMEYVNVPKSVTDAETITPVIVKSAEEAEKLSSMLPGLTAWIKGDGYFKDNALFSVILPGYNCQGAYYENILLTSCGNELALEIPTPQKSESCAAVFIIEIKKEALKRYTAFSAQFYDINEIQGG